MSLSEKTLLGAYAVVLKEKIEQSVELKDKIESAKTGLKAKYYQKKLIENNKKAADLAVKMQRIQDVLDSEEEE